MCSVPEPGVGNGIGGALDRYGQLQFPVVHAFPPAEIQGP
jgi:hypothetical protein